MSFFNNKEIEILKSRIVELEQSLAETTELMNEMSQDHAGMFVIKFNPVDSNNFELDGIEASNPNDLAYGGRKLSFAEAIMFKAGIEVSKREADQKLTQIASENLSIKEQLDEANKRIEILLKQGKSLSNNIIEEKKSKDDLVGKHQENTNTLIIKHDLELEKADKELQLAKYKTQKLEEELKQIKAVYEGRLVFEHHETIQTPYGKILGDVTN